MTVSHDHNSHIIRGWWSLWNYPNNHSLWLKIHCFCLFLIPYTFVYPSSNINFISTFTIPRTCTNKHTMNFKRHMNVILFWVTWWKLNKTQNLKTLKKLFLNISHICWYCTSKGAKCFLECKIAPYRVLAKGLLGCKVAPLVFCTV